MGKRIAKQIFYGIFFLAILSSLIFAVYYLFLRSAPGCFNGRQDSGEEGIDCGGVCAASCLPIDLQPITATSDVKILKFPDGKISLLAEIRNANDSFASPDFSYEFWLRAGDASSTVVDVVRGNSFVFAGEIKYLDALNFSPLSAEKIVRAELVIKNPDWQTAARFPRPAIDFQKAATNISAGGISVEGNLINNDTILISEAVVQALFKNASGQIVGVSETTLTGLVPGDSAAFTIIHPPLKDVDAGKTQLRVYTRRQ